MSKDRLKLFKNLDPGEAMYAFGDGRKHTAFIYSANSHTLYCQPGDYSHDQGLRKKSALARILKEPIGIRVFLGRFGVSPKGGGFVTIWGVDVDNEGLEDDYLTVIEAKVGTMEDLKAMLKGMVDGSIKVVGTSPATLPITDDYVVATQTVKPKYVSDFIGKSAPPEDAQETKCRQFAKLTIDGRNMDYGTALNNFHMVRGPMMDKIKASICTQGFYNKDRLKGCDHELELLNTLMQKAGCGTPEQNYRGLVNTGKQLYARELGDIFKAPDRIDTEFRGRQKDIDDAWDFLQKHRECRFHGFRNWLNEHDQQF